MPLIADRELIDAIEEAYLNLEHVLWNDASKLSNHSRAGLRRVQGNLQRTRLSLYARVNASDIRVAPLNVLAGASRKTDEGSTGSI